MRQSMSFMTRTASAANMFLLGATLPAEAVLVTPIAGAAAKNPASARGVFQFVCQPLSDNWMSRITAYPQRGESAGAVAVLILTAVILSRS
jgi:hypothetical protein